MHVPALCRRTGLVLALACVGLLPTPGVAAQDFEDPDEAAAACWPDEEPDTSEGYPQWSDPPAMVIDDSGDTTYSATFETSAGDVVVELLPAEAPETVNNFVCLAWVGYYDGVVFHRVVPGFVIQGGDPTATGRGGPGYEFEDEPIERDYEAGTLAMANAGPDTNGSQFFIVLEGGGDFLTPDYTIFGQVADEDSMEVVEAIGACEAEGDELAENGECDVAEPVEIETIAIEAEEAEGEDEEANLAVEGDDYEGAIFSEATGPDLIAALQGPSAADEIDYWTPDEGDIEALEDGIEDFLAEAADDGDIAEDLVDRLPEYARQYAGIVDGGDELIFANFFCDDLGLDWQTEPVAVEDGGDCFFTLVYDPAQETYSDLQVNGEA